MRERVVGLRDEDADEDEEDIWAAKAGGGAVTVAARARVVMPGTLPVFVCVGRSRGQTGAVARAAERPHAASGRKTGTEAGGKAGVSWQRRWATATGLRSGGVAASVGWGA